MGKVYYEVSMSVDGFISGAHVCPEAGLGDDGERLHAWLGDNTDPYNRDIHESWANTKAILVGRTTYDLSIPYWGADGPLGEARIPTVIVSHSVPQDIPQNSVYTFVDGIEAALETAKALAGDGDISTTGANVAHQLVTRGYLDEISLHVVPVIFGSGTRLFEGIGSEHVLLEIIEVIETAQVLHQRFRVVK